MRKILLIIFLLAPQLCFAEQWIGYDNSTKKINYRNTGDCRTLGICSGFNNTGLKPYHFEAVGDEYNLSKEAYKKINISNAPGNRVIDMKQAEIDQILADQAQAEKDALITRLEKFEVSSEDIIIALIKRINIRIPNNEITKQEIIQQLKTDKGL